MTAEPHPLAQTPLYPLRFEPIYEYRLWGGRRLSKLLSAPLPGDDPIGEAWLLSDRTDHPSRVANGPLQGRTFRALLEQSPELMLGAFAARFSRFPLLLKFLDVREMLSLQVHPADDRLDLLPAGETGKTEAWVVLEAGSRSRIHAGLKPGTTEDDLRRAVANGMAADLVESFVPRPGEAVLLPAGSVHALGGDMVVFEVQENSDVTFRLFDWGRLDPKTGRARALQVDRALSCIDFEQGALAPVSPVVEERTPVERERLLDCDHFRLWRVRGSALFPIGVADVPRVLVCVEGTGHLEHGGESYSVRRGDVWLLPAVVGVCAFRPSGIVGLLEVAVPE